MFKQLSNAFLFMGESADDPVVRMVEVEYTKEFNFLRKNLGRRPTRQEVKHLLSR
jgi:hypothetical protein